MRRHHDPDALLDSVVVPRPIAWVWTRSAGGVDNLAPHSFVTISPVTPPERRRVPYAELKARS